MKEVLGIFFNVSKTRKDLTPKARKNATRFHPESHLAGVVGTDGDAKRRLYEGVVDQVSDVIERFPIVFTGTEREVAVRDTDSKTNICPAKQYQKHSSPPIKIRLAEIHHEQRHRKRGQDQQHLGEDGKISPHLIFNQLRFALTWTNSPPILRQPRPARANPASSL